MRIEIGSHYADLFHLLRRPGRYRFERSKEIVRKPAGSGEDSELPSLPQPLLQDRLDPPLQYIQSGVDRAVKRIVEKNSIEHSVTTTILIVDSPHNICRISLFKKDPPQ